MSTGDHTDTHTHYGDVDLSMWCVLGTEDEKGECAAAGNHTLRWSCVQVKKESE